jgi:hypothetical protein
MKNTNNFIIEKNVSHRLKKIYRNFKNKLNGNKKKIENPINTIYGFNIEEEEDDEKSNKSNG